ncbi:MAG: hypothetical protein V3T82_08100 [Nitrospinaceae bacterium]
MVDHNLSTGEIVTCINGHPVYEITGEIPRGCIRHAWLFKAIPEGLADPVSGQKLIPGPGCPDCGEDFARLAGFSLEFHINGEWR